MSPPAADPLAEAMTWIEDMEPDGDEDSGQTGWGRTGTFYVPTPLPEYPETVEYVDSYRVADFVLWAREEITRLRAVLGEDGPARRRGSGMSAGPVLSRYERLCSEAPEAVPAALLTLAEALDEHRAVIRAMLDDVGGYVRHTQTREQAPVLYIRLDTAERVFEEGLP